MDKKYIISDAKVLDEREGIVEAYVNTMGVVDHDGDVIDPEAFKKSLIDPIHIPVLAGHDHSQIVGKVLTGSAHHIDGEEYKLFARMQMNLETQAGREAFSNIAGGFVREWSVGFNIPNPGAVVYDRGGQKAIRRIMELDLVEVSSVIRGASPATGTIAAKSADMAAEEKPYPNEHACRVREPGDFEIFRTSTTEVDGKSIRTVYGQEMGTDEWDIQSYRMPISDWSEAEARGYCDDHYGIKFEPATGEDSEYEDATASSTPDNDALDTVKAQLRLLNLRIELEQIKK